MQFALAFLYLILETIWIVYITLVFLKKDNIKLINLKVLIPITGFSLLVKYHTSSSMLIQIVLAILLYSTIIWIQNYKINPLKVFGFTILSFLIMFGIELCVTKIIFDLLHINAFLIKNNVVLHFIINLPIKSIMYTILYINYNKRRIANYV
jgi:hypothetical protein